MAASRRKMTRKPRQAVDWVVNNDGYWAGPFALAAGLVASLPLTYPASLRVAQLGYPGIFAGVEQWGAFVEGSKQRTLLVKGHILSSPSTWALGTSRKLMFRLIVAEMNLSSGGMLIPTGYNLQDAAYANETYAWQDMVFDTFTAGNESRSMTRVNAPCKRTLSEREALFLYVANHGNVTENITPMLRTLCAK